MFVLCLFMVCVCAVCECTCVCFFYKQFCRWDEALKYDTYMHMYALFCLVLWEGLMLSVRPGQWAHNR